MNAGQSKLVIHSTINQPPYSSTPVTHWTKWWTTNKYFRIKVTPEKKIPHPEKNVKRILNLSINTRILQCWVEFTPMPP